LWEWEKIEINEVLGKDLECGFGGDFGFGYDL